MKLKKKIRKNAMAALGHHTGCVQEKRLGVRWGSTIQMFLAKTRGTFYFSCPFI